MPPLSTNQNTNQKTKRQKDKKTKRQKDKKTKKRSITCFYIFLNIFYHFKYVSYSAIFTTTDKNELSLSTSSGLCLCFSIFCRRKFLSTVLFICILFFLSEKENSSLCGVVVVRPQEASTNTHGRLCLALPSFLLFCFVLSCLFCAVLVFVLSYILSWWLFQPSDKGAKDNPLDSGARK